MTIFQDGEDTSTCSTTPVMLPATEATVQLAGYMQRLFRRKIHGTSEYIPFPPQVHQLDLYECHRAVYVLVKAFQNRSES